MAMRPDTRPRDLARPGHVFPLRAREGGVLVRAGQTEAGVDLARMAGLEPGGVICEIMNPDGTMARVPELTVFCKQHGLKMISVADLIRYRLANEQSIERGAEGCVDTEFGSFKTVSYKSTFDGEAHVALVRGDVAGRRERSGSHARALHLRRCVRLHSLQLRADDAWIAARASPRKARGCSSICTSPVSGRGSITLRATSTLRRSMKPASARRSWRIWG